MQRSAGIVVHPENREAHRMAHEIIEYLQRHHVAVWLESESAERLGLPALACAPDDLHAVHFVLTLGGDGTILKAARRVAAYGVPILGVHMGRFGFIAEAHPNDVYTYLHAVLEGAYRIEERMMIRMDIQRQNTVVHQREGLNEAVVKSAMSHLLRLTLTLGGREFATYPADGVIVAVPTGSTAYSLSAGGPLVAPTVQALIITPICPHTLSARPLIVPDDEIIEIEVEMDGGEVRCAVDGLEEFAIRPGDRICIRRSEHVTRLITLEPGSFYRKVRARYLYGERLNE